MTPATSHFRALVLLTTEDFEDFFSSSADTEIVLLQKSSSELDLTFTEIKDRLNIKHSLCFDKRACQTRCQQKGKSSLIP